MKVCQHCRQETDDAMQFCPSCGQPFAAAEYAPQDSFAPAAWTQEPPAQPYQEPAQPAGYAQTPEPQPYEPPVQPAYIPQPMPMTPTAKKRNLPVIIGLAAAAVLIIGVVLAVVLVNAFNTPQAKAGKVVTALASAMSNQAEAIQKEVAPALATSKADQAYSMNLLMDLTELAGSPLELELLTEYSAALTNPQMYMQASLSDVSAELHLTNKLLQLTSAELMDYTAILELEGSADVSVEEAEKLAKELVTLFSGFYEGLSFEEVDEVRNPYTRNRGKAIVITCDDEALRMFLLDAAELLFEYVYNSMELALNSLDTDLTADLADDIDDMLKEYDPDKLLKEFEDSLDDIYFEDLTLTLYLADKDVFSCALLTVEISEGREKSSASYQLAVEDASAPLSEWSFVMESTSSYGYTNNFGFSGKYEKSERGLYTASFTITDDGYDNAIEWSWNPSRSRSNLELVFTEGSRDEFVISGNMTSTDDVLTLQIDSVGTYSYYYDGLDTIELDLTIELRKINAVRGGSFPATQVSLDELDEQDFEDILYALMETKLAEVMGGGGGTSPYGG